MFRIDHCHLAASKQIIPRYARITVSHLLIGYVALLARLHHG